MGTLKGFPKKNKLGAGTIGRKESSRNKEDKTPRAAIFGFAAKGPINTPVLIRDFDSYVSIFGPPSPEGESYMAYAAEQSFLTLGEIYFYRAADPAIAKTASVPVPGADNLVRVCSKTKEPYTFKTSQFFRWKLNGILSPKTLVVLATDEPLSAAELVLELNDQLTPKDGIQFYVHNEEYIAVRTTLKNKSELELVSVQDALYGPWGATGLCDSMSPAELIGEGKESYSFDNIYNPQLYVTVFGSGNATVDGVKQTIKFKGLEDKICTIDDIVDYINKVELPNLPGGWRACIGDNNALSFRTKHSGHDASISIELNKLATSIFGFNQKSAKGKSPKELFGASDSDASVIFYADSVGTTGNDTRVTVINDSDNDTFTINISNNGIQVESWGQLTKDTKSKFYVESFINLVSEWIRVVDNPTNIFPPKNGTYLLGDEKVAGAVRGCDGIPDKVDYQDKLIIGNPLDRSGLYSIIDKSLFEVDLILVPGRSSKEVIKALTQVCEKRRDCIALIDPPMELSASEATEWAKDYTSETGALAWPWVKVRDSHNRINAWVPPSGSVAATIANLDLCSPPGSVDGGYNRLIVPGVLDVFNKPLQEEKARMNREDSVINPILHYQGYDSFAINLRNTLSGERISAKRLLIYVEKKVTEAIDILLAGHELTNNELLGKISQICDHVLGQIKSSRCIYSYTVDTDNVASDESDVFRIKARIGIKNKEADKYISKTMYFEKLLNTFKFEKGD